MNRPFSAPHSHGTPRSLSPTTVKLPTTRTVKETAMENSKPRKPHTFFDFSAELREMIYSQLLKASYRDKYWFLLSNQTTTVLIPRLDPKGPLPHPVLTSFESSKKSEKKLLQCSIAKVYSKLALHGRKTFLLS